MAKSTALKIDLKGFDEMIDKLRKAGANVEEVGWDIARKSGKIFYDDLKSACSEAKVPETITSQIRFQAERDGSGARTSVSVGWANAENFNPKNPLPVHKVVFLNYGTPRRYTFRGGQKVKIDGKFVTVGTDRGSETGSGFISAAKKSAKPKIRKYQKDRFQELLKGI